MRILALLGFLVVVCSLAYAQDTSQLSQGEAQALESAQQSAPQPSQPVNPVQNTEGAPPMPPPIIDPNLITNSRDLEKKVATRVKDPFMLPNHLYMRIKRKLGNEEGEGFVDESVEPQRRWALRYYKLVGIIWNVNQPKAMITDKDNVLHMFLVKDRIGNNEGQITAIRDGEVVVTEKGVEVRLRLSN